MKKSTRPRSLTPLSAPLNRHLGQYALAASAAGVGMLALAQAAEAKIVYTKAHVVLPAHSHTTYGIDLNHDGIVDFFFFHRQTTSFFQTYSQYHSTVEVLDSSKHPSNLVAGLNGPQALRAGSKIGSSRHFSLGGTLAGARWEQPGSHTFFYGAWASGGRGLQNRYAGLHFVIRGKNHLGWARVSVSKWPYTATLTGYAYETVPNKPIIAGKTKGRDGVTLKTGSLGVLAAGVR